MNALGVRKTLNVLFIHGLLLLTVLPSLGWVWHRVLPEHTHVFIGVQGTPHSDADELLPTAPASADLGACLNCSGAQIRSGLVHLPSSAGLQVLGIFVTLRALSLLVVPPAFAEGVTVLPLLYQSPVVRSPDPPPEHTRIR